MLSFCQRKGSFTYSPKAKQVIIGSNRRRGRPRLTTPALKLQEEEFVFSDTADTASEDEEAQEPKKRGRKRKVLPATTVQHTTYDLFADDDNEENQRRVSKRIRNK